MKKIATSLLRVAAGAALAAAAIAANAATYDFKVTGDYTAHWQLPSSPTPGNFYSDINFSVVDHPGDFPGSVYNRANIYFYAEVFGSGIAIIDYSDGGANYKELLAADSVQLYTGTEAEPTFKLGTFALTGYAGTGTSFTLTITDVSAVPEPASLALMLGGLGLVGFAARRRMR